MRIGIVAGAVVLLGAAAGVAGALIASQSLRPLAAATATRDFVAREPAQQQLSAEPELAPANVDRQRVETALPKVGSPNLDVSALHTAAIAPSAAQTPTVKVAMPTQSAPQHTRPAFKPETATAPVKVTHAAEMKKPTAASASLFDDIN